MSMKISSQDAQIMRNGSARFPMKGTSCVPACAFYWCCQNGEDGKDCAGFQLINGQVKRHLQEQLGEDALKYIENSYGFIERAIQNNNFESVEVVTRSISQLQERVTPQPTQNKEGFSAMLEASRGVQNNPTQEPDPVERSQPSQGFIGMVESAFSHEPTDRTLTRAVDPNLFPDICDGKSCPAEYQRNCSANRAEHYGQRCVYKILTNEEMKHPEPQQRIAKRATLPELLERLSVLEKSVLDAETSPKNDHIFPNRPNLCKTKNPNGLDET